MSISITYVGRKCSESSHLSKSQETRERSSPHRLKDRRKANGRLIETSTMPASAAASDSDGINYAKTSQMINSAPNEDASSDHRQLHAAVDEGAVAKARRPLPLSKDNRQPTPETTIQRKTTNNNSNNDDASLLQPTTAAKKKTTDPRIHLDLQYLTQASKMLETSHLWSFNVFKLNYLTNGRSLYHVTLHLFQRCDFIRTFQLDVSRLMRCLNLIESSYYFSNPYHNSVHAADVVQAMFVHLSEPRLESSLKPLEKMAAILAAACHDVEHPGTNQGFLVATSNPLCTLYDNQSVLENHHWRSTIAILQQSKLFEHLDEANWLKMKSLIQKMILATDITKQSAILSVFRDLLKENHLNLSSEEEHRSFILQITLKCADISNPCRPWQLSKCWSELICEEFFHQGDLERRLGLPVTSFCDRAQATIANIQTGFMSHVAEPLFVEWNRFMSTRNSETMIENLRTNRSHWESMDQQQQRQQQQQRSDCPLVLSETMGVPSAEEVADDRLGSTAKRQEEEEDIGENKKKLQHPDANEDENSRKKHLPPPKKKTNSSAKDSCQRVRRLSLPVKEECGHRPNFFSLITRLAPVFEVNLSSSEELKKKKSEELNKKKKKKRPESYVRRCSVEGAIDLSSSSSSVLRINRINVIESQKDKAFNDRRCQATRERFLFPGDVSGRRRLARKMSLIVPRDQHAVALIDGRRRSRSLATATLTCSHHLLGGVSRGEISPQQWAVTSSGMGLWTSWGQKKAENLLTAKLLRHHSSDANCFQPEGQQQPQQFVYASSTGLCHVTAAASQLLPPRQRPVLISRVLEMNFRASKGGGPSRTKRDPSSSSSVPSTEIDPEAVPLLRSSNADRSVWLNEV